jgi:hypothetical protein
MKIQKLSTVQTIVGNKVVATSSVIEDVAEVILALEEVNADVFFEAIAGKAEEVVNAFVWSHSEYPEPKCRTVFLRETNRTGVGTKIAAGTYQGYHGAWYLSKDCGARKAPYEK